MFPFAQKMDDPPLAWSQEGTRPDAVPVSMLTRLTNAAKARSKRKADEKKNDDDDMPGPNAGATLFPFLALRFVGPATA